MVVRPDSSGRDKPLPMLPCKNCAVAACWEPLSQQVSLPALCLCLFCQQDQGKKVERNTSHSECFKAFLGDILPPLWELDGIKPSLIWEDSSEQLKLCLPAQLPKQQESPPLLLPSLPLAGWTRRRVYWVTLANNYANGWHIMMAHIVPGRTLRVLHGLSQSSQE